MATKIGTSAFADNTASATSIAASAKNVTSGNAIIAFVGWEGAVTLTSVTDNAGNTWTIDQQYAYSGSPAEPSGAIAYCMNCVGNAALVATANFSGSAVTRSIMVQEWSGLSASSPSDGRATNEGTGTTFSTAGITTTTTGIMVYLVCGYQLATGVTAGGTPASTIDTAGTGTTTFRGYYVSGSAQTITPGASWGASADRWVMLASTFKDGSSGAQIVTPNPSLYLKNRTLRPRPYAPGSRR